MTISLNTIIKKEIEKILENVSDLDTIEEEFKSKDFEIIDLDRYNEDIEEYSTTVSWEKYYLIKKHGFKFLAYISGTAYAEISYERWTSTYGHEIDHFQVRDEFEERWLKISHL